MTWTTLSSTIRWRRGSAGYTNIPGKNSTSWAWPVAELKFNPRLVMRGLIIDTELGNLLKANRFGYVKRASHGTRPLVLEAKKFVYSRIIVELSDPRYVFLNTLFSLSEACMYAQLVDLLDEGKASGRDGVCRPSPAGQVPVWTRPIWRASSKQRSVLIQIVLWTWIRRPRGHFWIRGRQVRSSVDHQFGVELHRFDDGLRF